MIKKMQGFYQVLGNKLAFSKFIPFNENDNDAQQTIEVLSLNCKRLVDRRKGIIKTLENTDTEYVSLSLDNCIEWFNGFYTVIDYMNN